MRRYAFRYSAASVVRPSPRRLPLPPRHHLHALVSVQWSVRHYTAIPLSKLFVSRGGCPQPAGRKSGTLDSSTAVSATELTGASARVSPSSAPQQPQQETSQRPSMRCCAAPLASSSAVVERLRVSESMRPASRVACVRVPRLLVFGGDVVSVTALEALHARMRCIVTEALRCARRSSSGCAASSSACGVQEGSEEEKAEVDAFVREHITVVCPALPKGTTPEEAARKFTRQYPVARYCVDHGLPIIPVDDPKSLTRSTLLKEMLSTVQGSSGGGGSSSSDAVAAKMPADASRPARLQRSTVVAGRLPSHVLPASRLVRGRGNSVAAEEGHRTSSSHGGSASSGKGQGGAQLDKSASAAAHTWSVQGRPLDEYDLTVVVSFRYFLPQHLLRVLPPVINMHPSLLPRYRGASPIFTALRRNESVGGVSIIQMKPGQAMDSGSILWQCEVPMTPDMDIRLYFPLVTQIGAAGLCDLIFGEAPAASTTASSTVTAAAFSSASTHTTSLPLSSCFPHPMPHGAAAPWNPAGDEANTTAASSVVPSWVALRRSTLMPLVHRADGRVLLASSAATGTTTTTATPLRGRGRLSPYADRPELSLLSCIITTQAAEVESKRDDDDSSAAATKEKAVAATSDEHPVTHPDAPQPPPSLLSCRHWMTLCRSSSHITPEAVHAASTAHRALFFHNLESASAAASGGRRRGAAPVNKKQVSPAAAAEMDISTSMKCAEVFPTSVLSSHCDWPDSFTYSWKFAQVQEYRTFRHFSEDPHHAPLLPKDAAVLRFSAFTAREAFGVWRAFVGGDYFQPSVNATLDKGGSPVRNQLVHRSVRRLLRERAKALRRPKSKTAVSTQPGQRPQQQQHHDTAVVVTSENDETPVGIVVGKHVDLDVFSPAGLQLLTEAENTLRIPCTFTQVTNPDLVPPCVQAELAEVEKGGERCCRGGGGVFPATVNSSSCVPGRRVRFYRAPPTIFRSLLSTQTTQSGGNSRKRRCDRVGDEADAAAAAAVPQKRCAAATAQPDEPVEDEEAPDDYVPDVIHAAPPTEQQQWHIPPGTGYFPESDESYGAIKCAEGWLLWQEAHMKWSNKAQPAVLIRKGLAMKTGVLYGGLFSEYS